MFKKIFSLFLAAVLMLGIISVSAADADVESKNANESEDSTNA